MLEIPIPANGWRPRQHQKRLWYYLNRGGRRAVAIWHRRAGKDEVALHHTAVASQERVGNYWHCLPEYLQGRKAIWTAINPHTGKRRIDEAFPPIMRANVNDHEMFMRFHNGSTWQVVGSDRYDATMGTSPAGIIYSEHAISNPSAWAYHRPILEENNGFAVFITTPRGRNHAKTMFEYAQRTPGWFAELLSVHDTHTLRQGQLDEALAEYQGLFGRDVGTAQFEQEYLCNFNAAILGAMFAMECLEVRKEGRVLDFDAEPGPVHRAWDLGIRDDTSIWWFQVSPSGQILLLDHYAASGYGLDHYVEVIAERRRLHGWLDGIDYVPHDARVREWTSGKTRIETMRTLDLHPQLAPDATFMDGINAARRAFPLCVFHTRTDETGLAALEQYRREWDDDAKAFKQTPVHDWTSHPADAFRYLGLAWRSAPRVAPRIIKPRGFTIPPPPEPRQGGIRL